MGGTRHGRGYDDVRLHFGIHANHANRGSANSDYMRDMAYMHVHFGFDLEVCRMDLATLADAAYLILVGLGASFLCMVIYVALWENDGDE